VGRLLLLALIVLVPTGAWVGSSEATFPGPNGMLAFVRVTEPCKPAGDGAWACRHAIWTANADGSGLERVTGGTGVGNPAWSPDGRRIAFFDGNPWPRADIYVIAANGSGLHAIGARNVVQGEPFGWSPDGKRIVYAAPLLQGGKGVGHVIRSVEVDGAGERVHLKTTSQTQGFSSPAFSPDGRRLAYLASQRGLPSLYVARVDGSARRRIGRIYRVGEGRAFDWSPDGRRLVYVAWDEETVMDIWVANADGSGRRLIVKNEAGLDVFGRRIIGAWNIEDPAWSPDGKTILFKRSDMTASVPRAELAFVPAVGGDVRGVLFGPSCRMRAGGGPVQCSIWQPAWGRRPAG
jgi:Tol biopolymer transport system component